MIAWVSHGMIARGGSVGSPVAADSASSLRQRIPFSVGALPEIATSVSRPLVSTSASRSASRASATISRAPEFWITCASSRPRAPDSGPYALRDAGPSLEYNFLFFNLNQLTDPAQPEGIRYGLAHYSITTPDGSTLYGHSGEIPGYNTWMLRDPKNQVTIVGWANLAPNHGDEAYVRQLIRQIYRPASA